MEKQNNNRAYKNARKSIKRHFQENYWKPSFTFKGLKDFLRDYGEIRRIDEKYVEIYQGGDFRDVHPGTYQANLVDILRPYFLKHEDIRYIVIYCSITEWVPCVDGEGEYDEWENILGYEVIGYKVTSMEIAEFLGTV